MAAATMKPCFTVWTRNLEDEDSWREELSTDDIEEALLLAFQLGVDDTMSTVYERGRFRAGGRLRTGSILFWWSGNYVAAMGGEPVARGQGWPEGHDEFVTYEPVGAAALTSSNSPQAIAAASPPRRYRMIYCDKCGVEIPKNEANEFTRTVEVGRSSGSYRTSSSFSQRSSPRSFSTSSSFGRSSSSGRTYYKRQTVRLCHECYQEKVAADAARADLINKAIVVAVGVVIVYVIIHKLGLG